MAISASAESFNCILHGLRLASSFDLPELAGAASFPFGPADVVVGYGPMPSMPDNAVQTTERFAFTRQKCQFAIDGIGRFHAEHGQTIIAERFPAADHGLFRFYVTGAAFTAILFQREMFAMHGGCVTRGDGAVFFAGLSGQGKSTLTAALSMRGWRFLCDDRVVLTRDGSLVMAVPGIPSLNLTSEAAAGTGIAALGLENWKANGNKRMFNAPGLWHGTPEPLKAFAILEAAADGSTRFSVDRLSPLEALSAVREQINFESQVRLGGHEAAFLDVAALIVRTVPVYRIRTVRGFDRLEELVGIIEAVSTGEAVC